MIAVLYDVHGNLPALEAVLRDVHAAGAEGMVIGGDVLPGPMPAECLACLFEVDVPVQFIRGNGEREVLAEHAGAGTATLPDAVRDVMRWTVQQLGAADLARIAAWPATLRLPLGPWGDALFCHATPRSDTELFTRLTPDAVLAPMFADVDAPLVLCGHTHMPFDRTLDGVRIVNPGSVGMPFGEPGADWLLLGPDIALRHTAYDLDAAAERIRATAYPQASEFAEGSVLRPPSEAAMLERFTPAAPRPA